MQTHHYALLLLAVAIPAFSLLTAIAVVRSGRRRKWLWLVFVVVGVGKVGAQWVVGGQILFQPIAIQFLGAGAFKQPIYEPWVLWVSLPLGAVLFWLTKGKPTTSGMPHEAPRSHRVPANGAVKLPAPLALLVGGRTFRRGLSLQPLQRQSAPQLLRALCGPLGDHGEG